MPVFRKDVSMILKSYRGTQPQTHPTARAAENVVIIGDVTLEENSSLWYGVVARGDAAPIVIGADTNIQDGCILHADPGIPVTIGKNVTVGHGAILHGCTIGDNCLIGMGATLLNNSIIGEGCIIAAGALVTERTVIPPQSLVMGCPGKVVRAVSPEDRAGIAAGAEHYVHLAFEQLTPISEKKEEL